MNATESTTTSRPAGYEWHDQNLRHPSWQDEIQAAKDAGYVLAPANLEIPRYRQEGDPAMYVMRRDGVDRWSGGGGRAVGEYGYPLYLKAPSEPDSAVDEMRKKRPQLYASLDGATCAKEGKKLDANPYPETDDLHFVWLSAWTDERLRMMRKNSAKAPT